MVGFSRRGGPTTIEPVFVPTQMISGILPPVCTGENYIVTLYEERATDEGRVERVILHRFALTRGDYIKAVWTAVSPVQTVLNLVSATLG